MAKPRIVCVVGTRPDAIKTAPLVLELRRYSELADTVLVSTGQHREILDQVLAVFGLVPQVDLALMRHGQTLGELTARTTEALDRAIGDLKPDFVTAQGDTTTTFIASLIAFYRRVPFGHVEAGLRTCTIDSPFPEEYNRRAAALVAAHHYAPTDASRENLLREGYARDRIFVTGNTGLDAVHFVASIREQDWLPDHPGRVVLLTTHRRENWGAPQKAIAEASREVVETFPDVALVVAMHPNPTVRETLVPILGNHPRISLIEPPDYPRFVKLMQRSRLILTDSGGVQEEAPAFGIPVLVLRDNTERPEGVTAGSAELVGTDRNRIVEAAVHLLTDDEAYCRMARSVSPYGDGKAAQRIRYALLRHLGVETDSIPMWA